MLAEGCVLASTYRIERLLGQGGMACVYEVSHSRLPRRQAIKVITGDVGSDPTFLRRFRNEAEILARLRHPHVVEVSDWNFTADGKPYLVMELLEGEDLAQRLSRTGAMSLEEALPIFLQIGDALQAAHDQGVIHRDLKPANIFLLSKGAFPNYVKVLDFGIAKSIGTRSALRTKEAELLGTPAYMAPEQIRSSESVGVRSDQYALALVLYEMLTGRSPFYTPGDEMVQTLMRVLMDELPPLPYPHLEPVLRRALSKQPEARFDSVRDLVAATGALDLSVIRPLLAYTRTTPIRGSSSPSIETASVTPPGPVPTVDLRAGKPSTPDAVPIADLFAAETGPCKPSQSPPQSTAPAVTGSRPRSWPDALLVGLGIVLVLTASGSLWRTWRGHRQEETSHIGGPQRSTSWVLATADAETSAALDLSPADLGEPIDLMAHEIAPVPADLGAVPVPPESLPPSGPPSGAPPPTHVSKPQRASGHASGSRKTQPPITRRPVLLTAGRVSDLQRAYIERCVNELPLAVLQELIAKKSPLRLGRTGSVETRGQRLTVLSDQLMGPNQHRLCTCLRPMHEDLAPREPDVDIPVSVEVSVK